MSTAETKSPRRSKLFFLLVGATAISLIGSASILAAAVYIHWPAALAAPARQSWPAWR